MGMPVITPGTGSREQAITDLIESVALQEASPFTYLKCRRRKNSSCCCNGRSYT